MIQYRAHVDGLHLELLVTDTHAVVRDVSSGVALVVGDIIHDEVFLLYVKWMGMLSTLAVEQFLQDLYTLYDPDITDVVDAFLEPMETLCAGKVWKVNDHTFSLLGEKATRQVAQNQGVIIDGLHTVHDDELPARPNFIEGKL